MPIGTPDVPAVLTNRGINKVAPSESSIAA